MLVCAGGCLCAGVCKEGGYEGACVLGAFVREGAYVREAVAKCLCVREGACVLGSVRREGMRVQGFVRSEGVS